MSSTSSSHNGVNGFEPFGKDMQKHFAFRDGWRNLNHGSFGTYPKQVRDYLRSFQDATEERPDPWLRHEQNTLLNDARASCADMLKVPASTIVMVPNVTSGINTVLRNLTYDSCDVILYFSTSYGACQNIIQSVSETTPASAYSIPLKLPMADYEIIDLFRKEIAGIKQQGKHPRVALIDTIASMPGVRLPFEGLIKVCKQEGIFSLIDAAHGIGHLKLNLSSLDPDAASSNCHKWLMTPRGSALMYVPERNQPLIRTSYPTSHYFVPSGPTPGDHFNPLGPLHGDDTKFTKMFEFVGTTDLGPVTSVPTAVKFRKEICGGEDRIMKYCADLAKEGGLLVARMLGTEVLDNREGTLTEGCAMVNIRLPLVPPPKYATQSVRNGQPGPQVELGDRDVTSVVFFVQVLTIEEFQTFIPLFFYEGAWWARLSAQIYLDIHDFEYAGHVLLEAIERVKRGDHLKQEPIKSLR